MSFSQNLARLKMSDRQQTRPHEGSWWRNFRIAGRKGQSEKPLERKTGALAKDWPSAGRWTFQQRVRSQKTMSHELKAEKPQKIKNWEKGEEAGDHHPLFLKNILHWRKLENAWRNWKAGFAGREGMERLREAALRCSVKEPRNRAASTNQRPSESGPQSTPELAEDANSQHSSQTCWVRLSGVEDPASRWYRALSGLRGSTRVATARPAPGAHRALRWHLHPRIPLWASNVDL